MNKDLHVYFKYQDKPKEKYVTRPTIYAIEKLYDLIDNAEIDLSGSEITVVPDGGISIEFGKPSDDYSIIIMLDPGNVLNNDYIITNTRNGAVGTTQLTFLTLKESYARYKRLIN